MIPPLGFFLSVLWSGYSIYRRMKMGILDTGVVLTASSPVSFVLYITLIAV